MVSRQSEQSNSSADIGKKSLRLYKTHYQMGRHWSCFAVKL